MRRASVRRHSKQQLRVSTITSAHSTNARLVTDLRLARFRQRGRGKHSETVRERADILQVLVTMHAVPPRLARTSCGAPKTFTLFPQILFLDSWLPD